MTHKRGVIELRLYVIDFYMHIFRLRKFRYGKPTVLSETEVNNVDCAYDGTCYTPRLKLH